MQATNSVPVSSIFAHQVGDRAVVATPCWGRRVRDACVMEWTLEETTMELSARLQLLSLG